MYRVTKRMEIAGAHKLNLPYESPCQRLHGHNWIIEVEVSSEFLNEFGMVVDFSCIKKEVDKLDHQDLNEVLGEHNPTAENIARWIRDRITERLLIKDHCKVTKVTVQESEGNTACYIP